MVTKTLLLLRHAKSSWKDTRLEDIERPLNARGRRAASRIGQLLRTEGFAIDRVLSSPSVRTRETAELVFAALPSPPSMTYQEDLYHAAPTEITNVLSQIADPAQCVMILGHNPGLEEFLGLVTSKSVHFPTAGLAQIELQLETWNQFSEKTRGRLVNMWRPREIEIG